jgi:hypothetical protein
MIFVKTQIICDTEHSSTAGGNDREDRAGSTGQVDSTGQGDIPNSRRDLRRLGHLGPSESEAVGIAGIRTGPSAGLAAGPARIDGRAFRPAAGGSPAGAASARLAGPTVQAMV